MLTRHICDYNYLPERLLTRWPLGLRLKFHVHTFKNVFYINGAYDNVYEIALR